MGRPVISLTTERTAPIPFTAPVPGQRPGWRTVPSTYISLRRPVWQPHAVASRAGPSGYGAFWRFRGRPIMATSPDATSTSTRSITSLRRLQRPSPASEPISRRSNRPSSPQGSAPARCQGTSASNAGSVPLPPSVGYGATSRVGVGDGVAAADGSGVPDAMAMGDGDGVTGGWEGPGVGGVVGWTSAKVPERKSAAARMVLPTKMCGTPTRARASTTTSAVETRPGRVRPTASTVADRRQPAISMLAAKASVSATGARNAAATP